MKRKRRTESEDLDGVRRAWRELRPHGPDPEAIEFVVQKKKSAALRLLGAPGEGFPVIAKRARRRTAEVERIVHERILPRLGVRSLHWHGIVGQDEEYCWFFLEDAGEDRFLPEDRNHRALAGRWLAVLHTAAEGMETLAGLPDRGARDALERLREGRDRILANLGNPAVSEARESLRVILERYDVVESRWEECEAVCDEAPRTLVHGDFAKKNLRVRCHGEQSEILVFDWENAGFGFPGNDLSLVEPADYWSVVRERWPGMAGESLERLFRAGRLFRCLAAINWESKSLRLPAPELRSVHAYAGRLDSVVREAGWIP